MTPSGGRRYPNHGVSRSVFSTRESSLTRFCPYKSSIQIILWLRGMNPTGLKSSTRCCTTARRGDSSRAVIVSVTFSVPAPSEKCSGILTNLLFRRFRPCWMHPELFWTHGSIFLLFFANACTAPKLTCTSTFTYFDGILGSFTFHFIFNLSCDRGKLRIRPARLRSIFLVPSQ